MVSPLAVRRAYEALMAEGLCEESGGGRIRVTPKFQRMVIIGMMGYLAFSVVNLFIMLFGVTDSAWGLRSGWLGIAAGLIGVALAGFFTLNGAGDTLAASGGDRPDLQSAPRVVAGGRALGSKEGFEIIYSLADRLGATVTTPTVLSSSISPEFREFERTATTVLSAYLTPSVASYLRSLDARLPMDRRLVMTSSGGLLPFARGPASAGRLVLSGPAAGAVAAAARELSKRLVEVRGELSAYRARLLTLQTRVAEQENRIERALDDIASQRVGLVGRIFERDRPPLWRAEAWQPASAGFVEEARRAERAVMPYATAITSASSQSIASKDSIRSRCRSSD